MTADETSADGSLRQRRRRDGGPTMADVAARAGVSAITVSRALSAPDRLSPPTLARVRGAMASLGYVPNLVAGALASVRTRVVGVVVPTITNSLFADTLEGMTDVFRGAGYQLLIGSARYDPAEEADLVRTFLGRRVDAMALTGVTHAPETVALLKAAAIPVVEIWNLTAEPIDSIVGFSNFEAARAMTLRLAERGRRRIGYLGGLTTHNDRTTDRLRGYLAAMAERSLPAPETMRVASAFDFREGRARVGELLARHPEIDAIFAASDVLAVGALLECQRLGIDVPGRVAIAGLDDSVIASETNPPLTTVRLPRYDIGRRAAETLLARLSGEAGPGMRLDLGYEIVERGSA